MTRRIPSAVLAAGLVLGLSTQVLAQVDTSRQQIPFLTGEAAELAAKMLAICGGASGQSRVTFTVKQAPPATPLTVTVGGIPQATVVTSSTGAAKLVFKTTPTGSAQKLDFDPREDEVEIKDDEGNTLASSKDDDGSTTSGTVINERASLTSTGVIPGASGKVRLKEKKGVRDFDVEIEDVPDGAYTLSVGGIERGTIVVSGGEGEIEFSDGGDDPEELPLVFDPLGALIQVSQNGSVILSGEALADAPGVNVCEASETFGTLAAVGPDADASGKTRFRVKDDCDRDLEVEAEDVPVGTYEVWVGGVLRGSLDVADDGFGKIEGEIEFDTDPDEPGEVLLDFDPAGQTVEVRQGGVTYLATTVGDPTPGTCELIDTEPDMTSTGADGDAKGKARLRQETDCDRDLRVEAEDVPVGTYELVVDGIVRGSFDVADVAGDVEGQIEFDNDPDQPGELLLDFDPRGATVEVRQGATVYLTVTLPD